MIKTKKRRKSSRFRGSNTNRCGFKNKGKGSGHRGGFGMAGTGKRADQRKSLIINLYGNDYFGKDKALRRGHVPKKSDEINLRNISSNLDSFVKKGIAKESKGQYDINLKGYKILGEGDVKLKLVIKASAASKSAMDKIKKAGGDIIVE